MRHVSDFPHTNCLQVSFFQQKLIGFKFSQHNKNLLFEVIVVFCYLFLFSHMYLVCCGLSPLKKGFTSFSLLPFT